MPGNKGPHYAIDLAEARRALAGLAIGAIERDFMGCDARGSVAVFLGEDGSPTPRPEHARATLAALETIADDVVRPMLAASSAAVGDGYRTAAVRAREPIFDPPLASPQWPLHEKPFPGYPHLVVARTDADGRGREIVRRMMTDLGGHEVVTRDGFGVALDVLEPESYEELHVSGACRGCRVLDDPKDPRPRAPEAIATAGLYVYGFADLGPIRLGGRSGAWLRIASPSVPADEEDLDSMARQDAPLQVFDLSFEDTPFIGPFSH